MVTCWSCIPFKRIDKGASPQASSHLFRGASGLQFFDAEEGGSHHDHLFIHAYKLSRGLSNLSGPVQRGLGLSRMLSFRSAQPPPEPAAAPAGAAAAGGAASSWFGCTVPERPLAGQPQQDGSAAWSRGDGTGFQLRSSNHQGRTRKADTSGGALYECFSADIVRADCKVSEVLKRLVPVPPAPAAGKHGKPCWRPGCPLPRVLCVVAQLPEQSGPMFGDHPVSDSGCSIVTLHRIQPETLRILESNHWPPHVQMFADFVKAGRTDLPTDRGGSKTSGLMKAVAVVGNLEKVGVPRLLLSTVHKYNGKPCLITKSGTVFKDPAGEWLEVDIDVRRFCYLARSMLVSLRDLLPRSSVHCGFTIQGCEDDELPEGIVCDMWLHNFNLLEDPRPIEP